MGRRHSRVALRATRPTALLPLSAATSYARANLPAANPGRVGRRGTTLVALRVHPTTTALAKARLRVSARRLPTFAAAPPPRHLPAACDNRASLRMHPTTDALLVAGHAMTRS